MYKFIERKFHIPYIKVIGIGGGGGNALNNMIKNNILGIEFIAVNTDIQSLYISLAKIKLQIGYNLTKGLGTGSRPEIGEMSSKESIDKLEGIMIGADIIFITTGLGGGTGTGATPVIANLSQRLGILTIGIVTTPFLFEGNKRCEIARKGIYLLENFFDTLITVPNNKLLKIVNKNTSMIEAFRIADETLYNAVKGISDIITKQGIINVDFADAISVMGNKGIALIGIGIGIGKNRSIMASEKAILNPLFEDLSIEECKSILINITGGISLTLFEVNCVVSYISNIITDNVNIIFGYIIDKNLYDKIYVTIIATGFDLIYSDSKLFKISNYFYDFKFFFNYKVILIREKNYLIKILLNILQEKFLYNKYIIKNNINIKKLTIFKYYSIDNEFYKNISNFYLFNSKKEFHIGYYLLIKPIILL